MSLRAGHIHFSSPLVPVAQPEGRPQASKPSSHSKLKAVINDEGRPRQFSLSDVKVYAYVCVCCCCTVWWKNDIFKFKEVLVKVQHFGEGQGYFVVAIETVIIGVLKLLNVLPLWPN